MVPVKSAAFIKFSLLVFGCVVFWFFFLLRLMVCTLKNKKKRPFLFVSQLV